MYAPGPLGRIAATGEGSDTAEVRQDIHERIPSTNGWWLWSAVLSRLHVLVPHMQRSQSADLESPGSLLHTRRAFTKNARFE